MQLIVQARLKDSTKKVWKLSGKKSLHIVGSSKKAEVYLPQSKLPVWMGLERRDSDWYILNLGASEDFIERKIEGPLELEFSDMTLELVPVQTNQSLVELASSLDLGELATKTDSPVLVVHYQAGRVVHSELLSAVEFSLMKAPHIASNKWQCFEKDAYIKCYYKQVPEHSVLIAQLKKDAKEKEPANRYLQLATALTLLIGLSFYLFLPKDKSASEVAIESLPPQMPKPVKIVEKKRPRAVQAQGGQAASRRPASKQNTSAGANAFGNNSRLAQMISRISGQKAVSKNVVILPKAQEGEASSQMSAVAVANQMGGSAEGLGKLGGATGVNVGTLSNQAGAEGQGRGLASVASGLTGAGGQAAASALDEEADVEGGLDPEVIAAFIRSKLGEILYCYERQLSANPTLYGKVGVRFIIGGSGQVESSRIFQTSLKSSPVESCITQRIGRWKFPTPKGGTQVVVTYPFLFKNTN